MAEIYIKSALEKLSSPEQVDKVENLTSPMSWLALAGVTLIVIVTLIWSFLGTIPVTITSKGIISSLVGSNSVYTEGSGTVVSIRVRTGDEIHLGDLVLTYKNASNEIVPVYSDQVGTISTIVIKKGDTINPGSDLIRVTPVSYGRQIAVCYVPLAQAKKLARGMQVNISLDSLDSQSYGNMLARIVNIDAYATPTGGMSSVLGTNNNLEATFTKNGAVVAVACELYPDPNTVSGYYWSNKKGDKVTVTNGSLITAKFVTEEVAPITKLFSKLKDLWGD